MGLDKANSTLKTAFLYMDSVNPLHDLDLMIVI